MAAAQNHETDEPAASAGPDWPLEQLPVAPLARLVPAVEGNSSFCNTDQITCRPSWSSTRPDTRLTGTSRTPSAGPEPELDHLDLRARTFRRRT